MTAGTSATALLPPGQSDPTPTVTGSLVAADIPRRAQILIGGVAVAAAVLSFSSLRQLAIVTGTWEWIAFLLPVSLDAAAGVAMFVWMRADRGHVIGYARGLTWASILLSIVCNGAYHGFAASIVTPPWYAAVAVGAIPPIMFGAVIHLAFLTRQPQPWGGPETVTVPLEEPVETPAPEPAVEVEEATAAETPRRALTPRVTTPLRRTPKPIALMPLPSESRDDEPAERPTSRRCEHQACGRLLPPGSRPDRKFCDATCRQAASRASRNAAVTA